MAKFYQTFKKLMPILLKCFQEIEREGTLSNSFYGAELQLTPKHNKDGTKRKRIAG
jgi:hypothetical protein